MTTHLLINVITPESLTHKQYITYNALFEKVTLYSLSEKFDLSFDAPIFFGEKDEVNNHLKNVKLDDDESYELYINSFEMLSEQSIRNLNELTAKLRGFHYHLIYIPVSYQFADGLINNKEIRVVKNNYPDHYNTQDLSNLITNPVNPVLASNVVLKNNEPISNKALFEKRLKRANKKLRSVNDPTAEQLYATARYLYAIGDFSALKVLIETHNYVLKNNEFTEEFFKMLFICLKKTKSKEVFELSSHLINAFNKDPRYLMYLANLYLELGFEEDYMPRATRAFALPVPNESELIYSELALNLPRFIDISLRRGEYVNVFDVVPKYLNLGLVDRATFKAFIDFQLQSFKDDLEISQIILKFPDNQNEATSYFVDYRLTKGLQNNFGNNNLSELQVALSSYWRSDKAMFKKAFASLPKEEQERVIISAAIYDHKHLRPNNYFKFNKLYKTIINALKDELWHFNVQKLKGYQLAVFVEELVLFRDFDLIKDLLVSSERFSNASIEQLLGVFTKYHLSHAELTCLQILLNSNPAKGDYWLRAGELLFVENRFSEAINFLEVARNLNKKSNKIVELLILSYEREGRHTDAKQLALSLPKESLVSNFIYHRQL